MDYLSFSNFVNIVDIVNIVVVDSLHHIVFTFGVSLSNIYIVDHLLVLLLLILSGDVESNPGPATHFHKKKCSVLYSNIRGLRSNFLDLQGHARNYDIIFLSETLVTSNKSKAEFLIPGFSGPDFIYRRHTPGAQGMAVYSKSGQPIYRQKNLECKCHEVLCFKIFSKHYNIYIFALYRNPGHDDSIYDCLLEGIGLAQSLDKKACFVISGDCNAKHQEWLNSNVTDQHGRSAREFCTAADCLQLIQEPTHISGNRLDLVFTDVPAIVEAKVCEYLGTSDHCSIRMNIDVNQYIPNATIERRVWLKSRADWIGCEESCQALNFSDAITDPRPMAKTNDMLSTVMARHIPSRIIKIRTSDLPWFDESCRRAFHEKQTKFNAWRRNRSQANYDIFVESRRAANRVYHRAERDYNVNLKRKLTEIRQPHLWWTKLKSAVLGSSNSSLPPLLLPDGKLTTNPREKAELLHRAFEAKQSAEVLPLPDTCIPEPQLTGFAFRSRDVKNILDSLDSWGGVDPDNFLPLFFKKMSSILAPKLSRLYRFLFRQSTFPDERKLCNIVPIPKGTLSADCSNYRPISILPVLSKVAEKLIYRPLYRYLESNSMLANSQYAYRKQLGTCDALLDLTCFMQDNLDKGFESRLVQIDFSAAFDLVNHKALIFKLQNLGIGGYLLGLLHDFLTDRQQRVVVDGAYSEPRPVVSGVPQGSVLGPLLFLIFTSDMVAGLENKIVQYADDTTLVAVVRSPEMRSQVAISLNRDLERIGQWCSQWGMRLNSSKTKTMLVSRSRTNEPPHPPLSVGNTPLAESEFLTILGVTFDSHLTFEKHLSNVSANAARKLGIVRKASYIYNNEEINATCFRSFVLPLLEYCSPVWMSASARDLSLLDKVARGGRFLFPNTGSYDLDHRRIISCLSIFHKLYFNRELPLSFLVPDPLPLARATRFADRQHQYALSIPRCRTSQFQRSFLQSTVKQWNDLPAEVMHEVLQTFKRGCNAALRGIDFAS